MSDSKKANIGSIGWFDLTVKNAAEISDFYKQVTGWTVDGLAMGEYEDYVMKMPNSGNPVAGVCHAQGMNAALPPCWLMYITVENIEVSIADCVRLGGKLISPVKNSGGMGTYCVIQDPAGAYCALFEAS